MAKELLANSSDVDLDALYMRDIAHKILTQEEEVNFYRCIELGKLAEDVKRVAQNGQAVEVFDTRVSQEDADRLFIELGKRRDVFFFESDGEERIRFIKAVKVDAEVFYDDLDMETLQRYAKVGREAQESMARFNLRLVVGVAKKYRNQGGMVLADFIQEGNFGLLRAVEKFDWTRGNRFSTYATWWIRQAVTRAIAEQSRTVRVPVHVVELLSKYRRAASDLQNQLQREPTDDEVAREMSNGKSIISADRVREIRNLSERQQLSLDDRVGPSTDDTRVEFLADPRDWSQVAEARERAKKIQEILEDIKSPRTRLIIERRFGIEGGRPRTLSEISAEIGVTRERVRQIEKEEMARLRKRYKEEAGKLLE